MWPVKGITAGGSRITFIGERLNPFAALEAHFIPPEDTGLSPLYGYADSRSKDLRCSLSFCTATSVNNIDVRNITVYTLGNGIIQEPLTSKTAKITKGDIARLTLTMRANDRLKIV